MWEETGSEICKKANCSHSSRKECGFEVKKVRYADFLQTIRLVYSKEGVRGFIKGIGPRMCINVPSTALSWGTYELIKGFLSAKHE